MNQHDQVKEQHVIDLGALLQKARIKAGFTPEQIAAKLRLRKDYIELLENNAFSELEQNATFVRGYIRSYARLVNIPKNQVDEAFALIDFKEAEPLLQNTTTTTTTNKVNANARPREFSFSDKKIRWITYGIILLLFILVIIWWRSQVVNHTETPLPVAPTVMQPESAETAEPAATEPVATHKFPMIEKQIEAEKQQQAKPAEPAVQPKPATPPAPPANGVNKLNMDMHS